MVKLDYLEPFEAYKVKPPMIVPENTKNRKKFCSFIIVAPSIEAEMRYLVSNLDIKFRYLTKYFIDKRWDFTLYGQGRKVFKLNEDGDITELLTRYKKGNLKSVDGITSYLGSTKVRPLKDMNVLVEFNYVTEAIMNNPKDRRQPRLKGMAVMNELERVYKSACNTSVIADGSAYLGQYSPSIILPIDLWMEPSDFSNPGMIFKPINKNMMAQIISALCDPAMLKKFEHATFYLIYKNIVLPISPSKIPADAKDDFIEDCIRTFFNKSRTIRDGALLDMSDDEPIHDTSVSKLKVAEEKTKEDIAVDTVAKKSGTDPDKISDKEKAAVKKVVKKANPELKEKKTEGVQTVEEMIEEEPEIDISDAFVDNIDDSETDIVLAAKMAGQSVQSYQRNEQLKEKYKELKLGNTSLEQVIKEEKSYTIPETKIAAKTIHEDMKTVKASQFEKSYNENLAAKDLVSILMHFSRCSPALFLNKDIQIEDVSTPTDRVLKYTVEFEDENRKRHRIVFKLPKMYKERYFYLNDQVLNITHQKFPYPVTKVSPNKCQAVSNYNKIFTERYGGNISPRITRIKKVFSGPNCPRFAKSERGDATSLNKHYLTTIEYDEIGSTILKLSFAKNTADITRIYFSVDDARVVVDMKNVPALSAINEESELIPLATRQTKNGSSNTKEYYFISGTTNKVYDSKGTAYGELSEFIITAASWYDDKILETFNEVSPGTKFVYSRSTVMAEDIPTIIMLGAADPGGLIAVLDKAQIKYEFTEKRPAIDKDVQGAIPFEDGWLVFDRYPYENSLLLNGLSVIPTKEFKFFDMGTREAYVEIFDLLYGRRNLVDGLRSFYYLFIDPITEDVLIRLKMPTDFTRVMLYCNDILADNTFQIDSDYHNSRLRSNEVVYAYLYKELADAWGRYKDGKTEKMSIPEDIILKLCMTSNIIDPHSELNLVLETENDRQVKLKGPSGMNEDHSFTLEKRAYHPSMMGVVGMNSTPSGEVGINRHLTLNANITDARGFIEIEKKEGYEGSEIMTPGELLQSFGPESADIERVAMAISQSKHVVPVEKPCATPMSYDMERVVPYLSTDFAFIAKKNGKVEAIENDVMIIKYDDGTVDDVDLSERPAKNTDGGFYIMNQLTSDLKPGSRVKEGQIVAYDPKYINDNDFFGDPLANVGTMARVAIETNGGVYEDACFITDTLAHEMATKITRQKRVVLSKFANIKYMVKVGQHVNANDPLLTFDDTQDEFTSQLLASMAEEIGDADEVIATNAPVISKVTGVIKDIRIYYTTDPEEMTPSMKKVIDNYAKNASKREKTISKHKDLYDANTMVKTSSRLTPDSRGKVKGVKLEDGIFIDFYIEYLDIMAPGDKLSYFTALKGIVSDIIPEEYAPYTEGNPDRKIDACLSCIGVYKRMCLDCLKVGMGCKILIEKKNQLKNKYHDRIKNELKK